ncbi:3349_t:CDS:2 [Cetraspora pellucida]|uniref:3349_t:CDS:1 n=1 Tax=Cetraspora pellucida TaxID=1433469 RepID=A0A9N9DGF7_9GLOM|nr:3349_t:CDS:2 [Cetraspora pellucida]
MPPLNKKRCQLKAARKSKSKHTYLEKNRTVYEYDEQDNYKQINEELNNHMWINEKINKRATNYFDILLLDTVLKKATQNIQLITFYLSFVSAYFLASNTTSICVLSDAVALVQLVKENRKKNIKRIIKKIIKENTKKNIKKNREEIIKKIVKRNIKRNIEENKKRIIEENTEKNIKENVQKRHVHLTTEQYLFYPKIPNRYIIEILKVSANHDSYWNIQLLAKQLKHIINILEIVFLNTIFVFGFDNSSCYDVFAKDALVASRINVKYDRKQL